jgi:hypothetical protein
VEKKAIHADVCIVNVLLLLLLLLLFLFCFEEAYTVDGKKESVV